MFTDWTDEAPPDESGLPAVTWCTWAQDTIDAFTDGPNEQREQAIVTLRELALYLDQQYFGGYHGIAPMPLEGCRMGWDW